MVGILPIVALICAVVGFAAWESGHNQAAAGLIGVALFLTWILIRVFRRGRVFKQGGTIIDEQPPGFWKGYFIGVGAVVFLYLYMLGVYHHGFPVLSGWLLRLADWASYETGFTALFIVVPFVTGTMLFSINATKLPIRYE